MVDTENKVNFIFVYQELCSYNSFKHMLSYVKYFIASLEKTLSVFENIFNSLMCTLSLF